MPHERQPVIACIEDQPDIAELIDIILRRKGYLVLKAYDGDEGLALVREHRPDVILLDLMMPGLDGWRFHAQLREDPELKDIPVIYVTARASTEERLRALEQEGAAAYIVKPFSPRELIDIIERVLQGDTVRTSQKEE